MENDTTDITRNGFSGEHRSDTPPDDTLRTDTLASIPTENVASEGIATDTAANDTLTDIAADADLTDIEIAKPLADVTVNETLAGITAEAILRDRRKRWKSEIGSQAETQIVSPDAKTVHKAVMTRFAKACDSSIRKRLTAVVFEPASPFDSKLPRRIRLETLILGSMLGGTVIAIAFFNLCARFGR
jgi:hypothetical protein